MAMGRTDYENVARILKGLPSSGGVRRDAVVSACQLFRARSTFDSKRFAREAGCEPCPDDGCNSIFDEPDAIAVMSLHNKLSHDEGIKKEVTQCQ